jgi:hypothetical protein
MNLCSLNNFLMNLRLINLRLINLRLMNLCSMNHHGAILKVHIQEYLVIKRGTVSKAGDISYYALYLYTCYVLILCYVLTFISFDWFLIWELTEFNSLENWTAASIKALFQYPIPKVLYFAHSQGTILCPFPRYYTLPIPKVLYFAHSQLLTLTYDFYSDDLANKVMRG